MKQFIFCFFIGFTLLSCSNDDDQTAVTNSSIIGNWSWIQSSGGIGGWTHTPESTGTIQQLQISATTIKRYINNELVSETNYTIETGESIILSGEHELLIEDNEFRNIIQFHDGNLFLTGDCNDCFISEYAKIYVY
ncbi:hypothetical protein [uncultured Kordia sp.]|uniref:hypothetical protein n=1 Tax=uncultured Kordia sp. TaxID=507699 RepID=UPI00262CD0D7|nr:hypothetical protein [uncultured Kordia sp.]